MKTIIYIGCLLTLLMKSLGENITTNDFDPLTNSSDANKDMYVIHAMVYQVGILTNKTDQEMQNSSMVGNQEALTFYHSNGSHLDLSNLPTPLMTNVTAQRLVGVAPVTDTKVLPWSALQITEPHAQDKKQTPMQTRVTRDSPLSNNISTGGILSDLFANTVKRALNSEDTESGHKPIKVMKGSSIIPQDVGVQSIVIPPLLALNNNLSEIPVPIPNTAVVQYAKVNTLVQSP